MKYKYVYLAIMIMTILHMYYVHAYTYHTYPSKRMVAVMNVTQPIPSPFQNDTYHNPYKHYSYHKQTLSLFYMKRRGKGQPHIR
jgi:hypothetical protein